MKILYVQMWDDFLLQHTGETPNSRIVEVVLTPEQEALVTPRRTGGNWNKEKKCLVSCYETVHPLSIQDKPDTEGSE